MWWIVTGLAVAVVAAACSGDDRSDDAGPTTSDDTADVFEGHAPTEIALPAAEGNGINKPQPAPALPEGYVEEEFFVAGTATSFDAEDSPRDGSWEATPGAEEDYRTRVIVRRPADPAHFSGTVLVEWFNVSAVEAAPDWGYLWDAIARDGHAYVGVSAQAQAVTGGDALLDVDVDDDQAAQVEGAMNSNGLVNIDPDRYGTLVHPGDAYSFDIFTQVARSLETDPAALLGDLVPQQVIAMGESQSAMFLSTLVNAVHPLDPVFDGFLIHSRGSMVPALDGTYVRNSRDATDSTDGTTESQEPDQGVLIRTDLDVPVMLVEAETDLTVLGYAHARQPDTDLIRTWEIAGTAHADSETLRAVIGGPRDPMVGDVLGCGSINAGPHKEVLRAAVHHLIGWVSGSDAPPTGERIEVTEEPTLAIVRDEDGNALGGIRNPLVDVPVAALSGDPADGGSVGDGICALFGQTIPFEQATLVERYGDFDSYRDQFRAGADDAVASGYMLQPDADALLADIEANRTLFP